MTTPQLSPPPPTVTTADGTHPGGASQPAPPRTRVRRTGRRIARLAVVVAVLLAVSAGANAVLTVREGLTQPYGHLITLPGGGKVNASVSGNGEETFVIMPGFGSASPVLEFAPLVEDLDDHATVVVVEPFGYGWSDRQTSADRTVENMATELHQSLAALHVHQPYTLVAHSIGALYALDYVNRFPGEVRAVVTIDGSPPIDAVAAEAPQSRWLRLWTLSGVTRWVSMVEPTLFVRAPRDTYSEAALRQLRMLVLRNDSTPALVEESHRMRQNVQATKGLSFPAELPVLAFVAQETIDVSPEWLPAHQEQLDGLVRSKLIVMDGSHYLHYDHSPGIADAVRTFLDSPARTR
ncbi:alpha/beta fold hydrolase [uncultured Friedmanniella sp.]|uniref:alpha/beta fold hydrolase n=1 Tax=uncultured Friedmanniella sp. TaxID=335381 RepID=UPI0035C98FA4